MTEPYNPAVSCCRSAGEHVVHVLTQKLATAEREAATWKRKAEQLAETAAHSANCAAEARSRIAFIEQLAGLPDGRRAEIFAEAQPEREAADFGAMHWYRRFYEAAGQADATATELAAVRLELARAKDNRRNRFASQYALEKCRRAVAEASLEAVKAASREGLGQLLCDTYPGAEGLSVGQVLDVVMPWLAALSAPPLTLPHRCCPKPEVSA